MVPTKFRAFAVALLLPLVAAATAWGQSVMVREKAIKKHLSAVTGKLSLQSPAAGANKVAVLTLTGDTPGGDMRAKVEGAVLDAGRFELIDRANLNRIITEIEFQEGAEIDPKTANELKIKGVDYVVVGSTSSAGGAGAAPFVMTLNLKMINCATAGTILAYNEAVQMTVDEQVDSFLMGMGPKSIIFVGVILLVGLILVFKVFGGAKSMASNTIFATVNDYLLSDKKIRESTGGELRQVKSRLKDAVGHADRAGNKAVATAVGKVAEDVDMLAQAVNGAPFGQAMDKYRAIPRDVADRLKAADLAFTDRVADFGKNVARMERLAAEGRFEGLDSDVKALQSEITGLKDKFDERGRILRSI